MVLIESVEITRVASVVDEIDCKIGRGVVLGQIQHIDTERGVGTLLGF